MPMTVEELTMVGKDLVAFGNAELAKIKGLQGSDTVKMVAAYGVMTEVITKIDELKLKFNGMTNTQAQDLAVSALQGIIAMILDKSVGPWGKLILGVLPMNLQLRIARTIVDLVVHALHLDKKAK